ADLERHQLLVVAPQGLHPHIADYLRTRTAYLLARAPQGGPSTEELVRPNTTLMHLGRVGGQVVPLESPWEAIYAKLQQIWGDRITPARTVATDPRAPAIATYTVQLTGGGTLRLEYDPAAKQVMILGPGDAAASCARLLTMIDH